MFKFLQDISNLYTSRDHIWKEFFKLQQTNKRRHKELLQRIHYLERKVSYGQPRGQIETFKTDSEEACCQGSFRDSK